MPDDDLPAGPLDLPALDAMGDRAMEHPLVEDRRYHPDGLSPRRLELGLDDGQYPADVAEVRIDVRWFEGGRYSVHYLERHDDRTWQCRWDRHPKDGAPVAHFHPPPDAGESVEPSALDADHHLGVLFAVLDQVRERVGSLYEE